MSVAPGMQPHYFLAAGRFCSLAHQFGLKFPDSSCSQWWVRVVCSAASSTLEWIAGQFKEIPAMSWRQA